MKPLIPMRILLDGHMIGQKRTGIERYTNNLIAGFLKHKNISTTIYTHSSYDGHHLQKNSITSKYHKPLMNNGLYRISLGLSRAIKHYSPDLLHVHYFAPFGATVPVVNTVHDLCFIPFPSTFEITSNIAFNYFFKNSLDHSNSIICVSEKGKDDLVNYFHIHKDKITVIYEAADPIFHKIDDIDSINKYLQKKFSISMPYFLVVGNIDRRKNPQPILRAFEALLITNPGAQLVFAGPDKINISKLINNKINRNTKILKYVSDQDLIYLYNGTQALIFNSLCEGFGLPLVEAMACGTPIICNDIPTFKEICSTSALYTCGPRDIFQSMKLLIKSNQYRKYSENSAIRGKYFSWNKAVSKTIAVYEKTMYLHAKS